MCCAAIVDGHVEDEKGERGLGGLPGAETANAKDAGERAGKLVLGRRQVLLLRVGHRSLRDCDVCYQAIR